MANTNIARHALVIGVAGGVGRALVAAFTKANYAVMATDHRECPANLAWAHFIQTDLAATLRGETAAEATFAQMGAWQGDTSLQALANSAALQVLVGVDSLTRRDWQQTLDVNLLEPFFWIQGLLPELEQVRGSVVSIGSIHARLTEPNSVAYATSEATLTGMTRALAVDLRGRVRVNAIEPAVVATDMLRAGFGGKPVALARLEACHSVGRTAQPAAIARAAARRWLAGLCARSAPSARGRPRRRFALRGPSPSGRTKPPQASTATHDNWPRRGIEIEGRTS